MHGFASLSDTTISCNQPVASRRRIVRTAGHSGVDLCRTTYIHFPESPGVLKNSREWCGSPTTKAPQKSAVRRRGRCPRPQGLRLRQPPRSPAPEREQPLYVLARGDHQRLDVHPPEPPEPE